MTFQVTKESIATIGRMSIDGEHQFKRNTIIGANYNQFLTIKHQNLEQSKNGSPRIWLKGEWSKLLKMVKKYINYEGRCTATFKYHMMFILHLNVDNRMNLPCFLLKFLMKMSSKVHSHLENTQRNVFHQGFLKLLVVEELNKVQRA